MLAAIKVKKKAAVKKKKSEQEHIRHFLNKTCNQEVSVCYSRTKQRQRNAQKCVMHAHSCFLLIKPIFFFFFFTVRVAFAALALHDFIFCSSKL